MRRFSEGRDGPGCSAVAQRLLQLRLRVESTAQRADHQFRQGQNKARTVGQGQQTSETFTDRDDRNEQLFTYIQFSIVPTTVVSPWN